MFALQCRYCDFCPQGSLGKRYRNNAVQIIAFSLEERMFLHVQNNIQIARRTAVEASFAISCETDAGAVFHARGDFRVDVPLSQNSTFSLALGTRIRNHAACALASGTGTRNAEKALLIAYLSPAITGAAR